MPKTVKSSLLLVFLSSLFLSGIASATPTAYFGLGKAYLLETQKNGLTAQLAMTLGAADGSYLDTGATRTVTLSNAIKASIDYQEPGCIFPGTADRYIQQVVFTRTQGSARKGQSEVVDIGVDIITGGCSVGKRIPFGSPSDAGIRLSHLSLSAKPSMTNVKPGSSWAGLHDSPYIPMPNPYVVADAADYLPTGEIHFLTSGRVVPSAMTSDGWWAFSLPNSERRYIRLTKADQTGAELWLFGDYANGRLTWAHTWWVIRRDNRASFGDMQSASRQWGDERNPGMFFTNLYTDLTADRYIFNSNIAAWWRDTGWTWSLENKTISMRKTLPNNIPILRTWSSVKSGLGYQWVLDQTIFNPDSSVPSIMVPRQLVRFSDAGPSAKP